MRRLVLALALSAAAAFAGIKTYPPSGTAGAVGGSGPDAGLPFGNHATLGAALDSYWSFNGPDTTFSMRDSDYYGYDVAGILDLGYSSAPQVYASGLIGLGLRPTSGRAFSVTTESLRQSGDFSVAFWAAKPTVNCNGYPLLVGSDYQVSYSATIGETSIYIYDSVAGIESATVSFTAGATYDFWLAEYDSATRIVTLSKNLAGAVSSSALANGLSQSSSSATVMQGNSPTGCAFDELGVWARKLTAGEEAYLYNAGAGRTY